jgi:hypothetical protein
MQLCSPLFLVRPEAATQGGLNMHRRPSFARLPRLCGEISYMFCGSSPELCGEGLVKKIVKFREFYQFPLTSF